MSSYKFKGTMFYQNKTQYDCIWIEWINKTRMKTSYKISQKSVKVYLQRRTLVLK